MKVALLRNASHLSIRTSSVIALLAAADGETKSRWIQVAKTGEFKNYFRKGKQATLVITKAMLKEMVANFSAGRHPEPNTEIPVDYEHLSAAPSGPTDGKAAGWFKTLELRDDGESVYGEVEWTEDASTAIEKKEFKYFSPEFALNYTTHDGEQIGCTLLAGALTNRPFLQGMEAVELRGLSGDVLATELSYDQRRMFLDRALTGYYRAAQGLRSDSCAYIGCWINSVYDDYFVFTAPDGRTMWADYTIAGDGTVTIAEPFEEVVVTYEALTAETAALRARGARMTNPTTITLRNANNEDVEVSLEQLEQTDLVRQLRADVAARVPKTEFDSLNGEVTSLKSRVDAQTLQLRTRDAKEAVDALITARRATPGQRESLTALYLKDQDMFTSVTASMTAVIAPAPGEIGHGGPGNETPVTATAAVNTEVAALRVANPKLSVEDAQAQVFASKPELYTQYVKETEQRVSKD
jgi:phage I-like protein